MNFIFFIFLATAACIWSSSEIRKRQALVSASFSEETPQMGLMGVVSLFNKDLFDDMILIDSLKVIGEDPPTQARTSKREFRVLKHYLQYSPQIESLYLFSCYTLAFQFHRPQDCDVFLAKGIELFPQSWRLLMIQGFFDGFVFGEAPRAIAFFSEASKITGSPPFFPSLVEKWRQGDKTPELHEKAKQAFSEIFAPLERNTPKGSGIR